ncbi:MAG: aminoglycoside phosphotransferase family protein [Candidatus Obscuribacterales bacterium]|nr:aminoglycoside phosphotransferase family protein [Candidatus Obscuribacterales bacterium]
MSDNATPKRESWQAGKRIALSRAELTKLVQPLFPGREVTESEPTQGGLSNTNVKVFIKDQDTPYLVRLYTRDATALGKEIAINKLVSDTVPSAKFLWYDKSNPVTDNPYVIMEWIEGERLEVLARSSSPEELTATALSLGTTLAKIHRFTFAHSGFLSDNLTPSSPLDLGADGLRTYIDDSLKKALQKGRIDQDLPDRLLRFFDRESSVFSNWSGPACLTHCDFGGSNILMHTTLPDAPAVAAVLDWEFAFSGAPYFDFGNLLRNPLGAIPGFADSVATGYTESGGTLPKEWRKISALADLSAWVEFLTREDPGDAVITDSKKVITATMQNWSTHSPGS